MGCSTCIPCQWYNSSKSNALPIQEVQTFLGARLRGATPGEALQQAEAAGSNLNGLDQGLSPPSAGSGRRLQDVSTQFSATACTHLDCDAEKQACHTRPLRCLVCMVTDMRMPAIWA